MENGCEFLVVRQAIKKGMDVTAQQAFVEPKKWYQVFAEAVQGLRSSWRPVLSWYGLYVLLEMFSDVTKLNSMVSPELGLTLVSSMSTLLSFLAFLGFVGTTLLVADNQSNLEATTSLVPGLWLKDLTLETIKALLFSLPWFFLFVIPGIVRLIRYAFVFPIVMLEPAYRRDQVNALKTSLLYSQQGVFGRLALLYVIYSGASLLSSHYSFMGAWAVSFILAKFVEFLVTLYCIFAVRELYYLAIKKVA